MNTKIITITNSVDELSTFAPVSGRWYLSSSDRTWEEAEAAVRERLDAKFKIRVSLYHADGRAITSEIPSEGTFVAARI